MCHIAKMRDSRKQTKILCDRVFLLTCVIVIETCNVNHQNDFVGCSAVMTSVLMLDMKSEEPIRRHRGAFRFSFIKIFLQESVELIFHKYFTAINFNNFNHEILKNFSRSI